MRVSSTFNSARRRSGRCRSNPAVVRVDAANPSATSMQTGVPISRRALITAKTMRSFSSAFFGGDSAHDHSEPDHITRTLFLLVILQSPPVTYVHLEDAITAKGNLTTLDLGQSGHAIQRRRITLWNHTILIIGKEVTLDKGLEGSRQRGHEHVLKGRSSPFAHGKENGGEKGPHSTHPLGFANFLNYYYDLDGEVAPQQCRNNFFLLL
jgi:hypothetical protein